MPSARELLGLPVSDDPPGSLGPDEVVWRDRQPWLAEQGYMLRPRYRKDWVPSWGSPENFTFSAEDALEVMQTTRMDATHMTTGRVVNLKAVAKSRHPYEAEISQFFSTQPLASHPRNHCCPLLEILFPPGEPDILILVTPLLRQFNQPLMESVGEAVEFFRQVFEGLQFMHQCNVAHRDCMDLNIMMDAQDMFPQGYHPVSILLTHDLKHLAPFRPRMECRPKYYFIDFGLSRRYDPKDGEPMEDIIRGGDKTVPEFQEETGPLNPFPTDIYYLGNMIRESFLKKSKRLQFMQPLVDDMVQTDPSKRPTIDVVVKRFEDILQAQSWWKLRSRLHNFDEFGPEIWGIGKRVSFYARKLVYTLSARNPLPRPRL